MYECEKCGMYFNLGINGGTFIPEEGEEKKLCNHCIESEKECLVGNQEDPIK